MQVKSQRAARYRIVAAVGMGLVCILITWMLIRSAQRADSNGIPEVGGNPQMARPISASPESRDAVAVGMVEETRARSEAGFRCRIVGEGDEAISSAQLVIQAIRDRYIPQSRLKPLAKADRDGIIELPSDWRKPVPGSRAVLVAPGYCSLQEPDIPGGLSPEKIVMKRACRLAIRCIDNLGRPVRDACASVSRMTGNADACFAALSEEALLPGPNPDSAIHLGRADENGIIHIGGLDQDEYSVAVRSSSMILESSLEKVQCGKVGELTARFRPVWIVGIEIAGDRVIAADFSSPKDSRDVSSRVARLIESQSKVAKEKWPNAGLGLGSQWGEAPPKVAYRLLCERSGYYSGTTDAMPLEAFAGPTVLPRNASNTLGSRSFHVSFVDAAGLEWPIDRGTQLTVNAPNGSPLVVPIDDSGRCVLPVGEVAIRSLNKLISGRILTPNFQVDDSMPARLRVPISTRVRECRFQVLSTEGWAVDNGYLSINIDGQSVAVVASDLRQSKLLLPLGRGTLTFSAMNMSAKAVPFTVEATASPEPQTIRVEIQTSAN